MMKKVGVKKLTPAFVAVAVALLIMNGVWGRYASGQDGAAAEQVELRDALRRGGLREAARIKGHYVAEFDPHWDFGLFDIEMLAKNSAAVIVGVPTKIIGGRLTPSGQSIVTDYEVRVKEVFKGSASEGSTVTVSLPGGLVTFDDGTTAELKPREFEPMKLGATYTLFLSESDNTRGVYILSGGPQGLVEIVDDTKVKSHGRSTDPISEESKGKDKDTFLKEVRDKAYKWPLPGKCCR
jgi:hypothetical protein